MYTKWTAHCKSEQEKLNFEADLRRAKPVLERLRDVMRQSGKEIERASLDFSIPSWPYHQAFAMGVKSSLAEIEKLIDLDKQKDTIND